MSKYVDRLRSDAPSSLYVFDQETPITVTNEGSAGINLSLIESGITAKAVPSIIPGQRWSVYTPVAYDFDGGVPANNYSSYKNNSFTGWDNFYNLKDDFTIESVFRTGYSTRSQGEGPVWGFYDGITRGLLLEVVEIASGWRLSVKINLSDGVSTLITHDVGYGEFVHATVVKTERNFVLLVNGSIEGFAQVSEDAELATGTFDDFNVVGDDAVRHSNLSVLGSLTLYRHAIRPEDIFSRYELLQTRKSFSDFIAGFGPRILIESTQNGHAVLAPELDDLFEGADTDLEYDAPTDSVTIKDSSLAAGFTAAKKLSYDLSDIEAIGAVYHDYTSTTPAGSSLVAEYSLDDTTYETLPTGNDAVPDINQVWATAAEGTL